MNVRAKNLIDYSGYLTLRLVIASLQAVPLSACDRFTRLLAWLACDVFRFRRKVVEENLSIAFPDWNAAERHQCTREMWHHLFLMVAEIAHTPRKIHRTNWRERCEIPKVEAIVRGLVSDRPKVIISGHYGNFELGGYLLGMFGFPTHTVARPIDNPYVNQFVNEFRGRTGQHILPKEGSSEAIENLLKRGGILALLGDQAAGDRGCWVSFFGKPASTHKAVSLFTLGFEAPTMVMATQRKQEPLRYLIRHGGAIDPAEDSFDAGTTTEMTDWFTQRLETLIRYAPQQYWWVHRRWKGTPPPRVARRLAAEAKSKQPPEAA